MEGFVGDVVAVGDGKVGDKVQEFFLQPGQTVLYSKFGIGVTDILVQGEQHCLIKEEDCIGVLPRSGATADDIPQLKPNGDRVLLKVAPIKDIRNHTEYSLVRAQQYFGHCNALQPGCFISLLKLSYQMFS